LRPGFIALTVSGTCDSQTLTFKAKRKSRDKNRPAAARLLVTYSTTSQSLWWSLVSGTQNR
jgi:hypothetical protein